MNTIQERWDGKLKNWALWVIGETSSGVGSAYDDEHGWGSQMSRPPQPLVGEALDTDRLVHKLSVEHQQAISAYYTRTGMLEDLVETFDPPIHVNTLLDRVMAARFNLEDLDLERRRVAVRPPSVGLTGVPA